MTLDENDLREGLRAMAADAPPAPRLADRSVGRATRIRRNRMTALAVATVVAVGVPAAAVRLDHDRRTPVVHAATTPIERWPRRVDPTLQPYLDRAIQDYRATVPDLGEEARPLYAAAVPGTDDVAVAFAMCDASCTSAVIAHARRDYGLHDDGDPGTSEWVWMARDVAAGTPVAPLALYLRRSVRHDGNVVVVVGPPETATVTWTSEQRRPDTGGSGSLVEHGGAFSADVGFLSAPAVLSLRDTRGVEVAAGAAGDADHLPEVRPAPVPLVPSGWRLVIGVGAQLGNGQADHYEDTPDGASALFLVCDGFQPIAVEVGNVHASVPCDVQQHRVDFPAARKGPLVIGLTGDPYTAYNWVLAKRS